MDVKTSHGGYGGNSIATKIEQKLDSVIAELMEHKTHNCSPQLCPITNEWTGEVNGLAFALSLMRSTTPQQERHESRLRYVAQHDGVVS